MPGSPPSTDEDVNVNVNVNVDMNAHVNADVDVDIDVDVGAVGKCPYLHNSQMVDLSVAAEAVDRTETSASASTHNHNHRHSRLHDEINMNNGVTHGVNDDVNVVGMEVGVGIGMPIPDVEIETGLVQDSHARYIAEGVPRDRCPYADHHEVILTLDEDGDGDEDVTNGEEQEHPLNDAEADTETGVRAGARAQDAGTNTNIGRGKCPIIHHDIMNDGGGHGTAASDVTTTHPHPHSIHTHAGTGTCPIHHDSTIHDTSHGHDDDGGQQEAGHKCPFHSNGIRTGVTTNEISINENTDTTIGRGECPIHHHGADINEISHVNVDDDDDNDSGGGTGQTSKCPFYHGTGTHSTVNEVSHHTASTIIGTGRCPIHHGTMIEGEGEGEISHSVIDTTSKSTADIASNEVSHGATNKCPNNHHGGTMNENSDRGGGPTSKCPFHHGANARSINEISHAAEATGTEPGKCPIYHRALDAISHPARTTTTPDIATEVPRTLQQSSLQQQQQQQQQMPIEHHQKQQHQQQHMQQTQQQPHHQPQHQYQHQHYLLINETPQTVSQARQKMNALISAQKTAQSTVKEAREKLQQAQRNLELAEMRRKKLDEQTAEHATKLTSLLLKEESNWNTMFQKLVEYKDRYGHCDVKRVLSREEREKDPDLSRLSQWVGRVRLEARRPVGHPERIDPYKIVALESIGFDFSPRDSTWRKNYEKLKTYMRDNGGNMPNKRKDPLGVWCNGQIFEFNKWQAGNPSYMTQRKIDLLDEIGFVWDRNSTAWTKRWEALKAFHAKHGHCRIPKDCNDQVLYRWVTKERIKYRNFLIKKKPRQTEEQWKLLKSIGLMEGTRTSTKKRKRKNEMNVDRMSSTSSPSPPPDAVEES